MIAINVTEFRGNVKKYLEAADSQKVIIHNAKGKAYAIIPVEEIEEPPFSLSPAQKKAIDEALDDVANGDTYSHEQVIKETKKRFPQLFKK